MAKNELKKEEQNLENVQETLTTAGKWIEANQNAIEWTIFGVVLAVFAWVLLNTYVIKPKHIEASNENAKAVVYFQQGDFEKALNGDEAECIGFAETADNYRLFQTGKLAALYAGICYYQLGDFEQAAKYLKRFNAKDGLGITTARRHGLRISVITGRKGPIVQRRTEELGIAEDALSGISAKKQALLALAEKYHLALDEIAFMGDDLNDLPALLAAGLSAAPADAAEDVRQRVAFIAPHKGGHGAVRDLLELILKARGIWDAIVEEYSEEGKGDRQ